MTSPSRGSRRLSALLATLLVLGASHTAAADLTVTIDEDRAPALRDIGGSVTLETTASGTGLQWYHNGAAILGANAATLQLNALTVEHSGNYWLTRAEGAQTVRSNTATLNVLDLPGSGVDIGFSVSRTWAQSESLLDVRFGANGSVYLWDGEWVRFNADGSQDSAFVPTQSGRRFLGELPNGERFYSSTPYRVRADGSAAPLELPTELKEFLSHLAPDTARFPVFQADAGRFFITGESGSGPPATYNPIRVTLQRFNADGTLDNSFAAELPSIQLIDEIADVQVDSAGRTYVTLLEYVPHTPLAGTYALNLVRLLPNGSRDTSFPLVRNGEDVAYHVLGDDRVLQTSVHSAWRVLRNDGSADPAWEGQLQAPLAKVDRSRGLVYHVAHGFVQVYAVGENGLERRGSYFNTHADLPSAVFVSPSGAPHVTGLFSEWGGHITSRVARLSADAVGPALPLVLEATQATPNTFNAWTGGAHESEIEWVALDGQPLPAAKLQGVRSRLNMPWTEASVGRVQPRMTTPAGTMLGPVFDVELKTRPHLAALSGRAAVAGDEKVSIIGLAGVKGRVLVRGGGPALSIHGVSNYLADPVVQVFDSSGAVGGGNDDWGGSTLLANFAARAGASPYAVNSLDSAIVLDLGGVPHTAILSGKGGSGVALFEAYLDPEETVTDGAGPLGLALRAYTGEGENTAIVGFVLHDNNATHKFRNIVIRAIGPGLEHHGVQQPLADPMLTVFRAPNTVVATNDNWHRGLDLNRGPIGLSQLDDFAEVERLVEATGDIGLAQLAEGGKDAAMLVTLEPGIYTAHVTGGAGIVLLEIYAVP